MWSGLRKPMGVIKYKMNIVAIIPARGGSKSLPKKNILPLAGKPVIAYTIEIAKSSKYINRIVVSTDDQEIAKISKKYGAEIPFLRPKELSGEDTTTEAVLKHAVEWIEEKEDYKIDIVVFFQVTDFFKKVEWVDETIEYLIKNPEIESAFIGCKAHKNFWKRENDTHIRATPFGGYGPRQKRTPLFREDTGLGCAIRSQVIKQGKRLGNNIKLIEKEYPLFDIHGKFDLWLIEKILTEWKEDKFN